jgi:4,5-DOPA dioxygenase extradiol
VRRITALFVSHGAPSAALEDDDYTRALGTWAREQPPPRAIVVVSAHGEARGAPRVSAGERPHLIYDFHGFPPPLYALEYPAPGSPELATEVAAALVRGGLDAVLDTERGFDHGVWVPLRLLYSEADVPVVQVSLPVPRSPGVVLAMGTALAPLRERGVLLMGSGGIVHNLRRLEADDGHVAPWAEGFDSWVAERLGAFDVQGLLRYASAAPDARLAAPTSEHFDPLFFLLGCRSEDDRLESVFTGFRYGTLSLRSFALTPR